MELFIDSLSTPAGEMILLSRENRLYAAEFDDGRNSAAARMRRRFGDLKLISGQDTFGFASRLRAWFAGDLQALDEIVVETGGAAFQQRVWKAVRAIPPGQTRSYREIASALGSPAFARAVGRANALNPVAIVIPCHRVIGSGGELTGYAAGIHRKRWLLDYERSCAGLARQATLFR
jgi:methylated-DNA-[protein]-cysteine S-methyltransferase